MHRFFAIYHNLIPSAPWGVAVERESGSPRVELLMLCRTQQEAERFGTLTSLGQELQTKRDQKGEPRTAGGKR